VVWQPNVESRPHPFGESGVRSSLEEVCQRAATGASEILATPGQLARVRTYAAKILKEAKAAGRQVHRPGHRARELLSAVQERKLWIPDPIGIEYIPAAHLMACDGDAHDDGTPCLAGDDCDGKVVLLAALFMAVGLYTMVVGHAYDADGNISHVLTKVYFDGRWHYADPSQLSNGSHQALGKCVAYTRERYYSMPEIKVVCDAASCDARNFDPEEVGFVKRGTFVGVNGIPVVELPPEAAVRWLGDVPNPAVGEQCKEVPYSLDKFTLEKFADRCGTELAMKWVSSETGVDVSGCAGKGAKASADCVANNYGGTIDIIDSDGHVKWHNVVKDAGAVGGILVCSAVGAEVAATVCGKVGSQIAQAIETIVVDVGKFVLDLFWGGSDGGGWACGPNPFNGVPLPQMARDIASFMRWAKTFGNYPPDALIGPPIFGTLGLETSNMSGVRYWSRLLTLRGLAQTSAILADEIARRASTSLSVGIQALAPFAPPSWTELVKPDLRPTTKGSVGKTAPTPDYVGNVGGLLTAVIEPDLISIFTDTGVQPIVPRWQLPEYWYGVTSPPQSSGIWRYFMVVSGCPSDTVVWGDVVDQDKVKTKLAILPGAPGHDQHQSYILYSIPKDIDSILVNTDNAQFLSIVDMWKKSLTTDMKKKIDRARVLGAASSSSSGGKIVAAAAAAGALWFGWRYFFA
jgi:hypothetical protein